MFANPGGMHPNFIRIKRLVGDIGNELVRCVRVVFVMIVAQGEIAELHGTSFLSTLAGAGRSVGRSGRISLLLRGLNGILDALEGRKFDVVKFTVHLLD